MQQHEIDRLRQVHLSFLNDRPPSGPISLLAIEASFVLIISGGRDPACMTLRFGRETLSKQFFRHAPPTPDEIEYAINLIEEELERIQGLMAAGSQLFTIDGDMREIARSAGVPESPHPILSRDALESFFTRIAYRSMGRSSVIDPVTVDPPFVARVLILREVMFHLGFTEITIV